MFNPWYKTMMLAFDSNSVIKLRLAKIQRGGVEGRAEAALMVKEKMNAASEAASTLMKGGTLDSVVDLYRGHVTANIARLSPAASAPGRDRGPREGGAAEGPALATL
jgi:hypothetical protein